MEASDYRPEIEKLFEYLDGYIKKLNKKGISDDERTKVSFFFFVRGKKKSPSPFFPTPHPSPTPFKFSLQSVPLRKYIPLTLPSTFTFLSLSLSLFNYFFLRFSKKLAATARNLSKVAMMGNVENWVKFH